MRPPFTTRAAWRAQAVRAQARCAHKHPRICALHQSVSFNSECSSEGAIRADPVDGSARGACACSNNAIKVQSYHADTPLEVREELGFVVHAKKRRRRDAHAALQVAKEPCHDMIPPTMPSRVVEARHHARRACGIGPASIIDLSARVRRHQRERGRRQPSESAPFITCAALNCRSFRTRSGERDVMPCDRFSFT
jgi:hypothetical protein